MLEYTCIKIVSIGLKYTHGKSYKNQSGDNKSKAKVQIPTGMKNIIYSSAGGKTYDFVYN